MISRIDLSQYLNDIELVVVGGESDKNARILDYNWVLDVGKTIPRTVKLPLNSVSWELISSKTENCILSKLMICAVRQRKQE